MAENHHSADFHMWGQSSNAYNLHVVGKELLWGSILPEELRSKNGHILRY